MNAAVSTHGDSDGASRSPLQAMPISSAPPRMSAQAEARLRKMVDLHFDFVWRSLRGLGVPASTVDDAAQQVFWIAAKKVDLIAEGSERSFLFTTARGIASNARRGQARSREVLDEETLAAQADHAPSPEQIASSKQARQLLDRFLDGLPEDVRTVFMLFELEGLTMAAIAELLDLPMGTVASRLRRAREEFQAAAKRFRASEGGRS